MQYRERKCDLPLPKYGGKNCDGLTDDRSCEEGECQGTLRIFRFY